MTIFNIIKTTATAATTAATTAFKEAVVAEAEKIVKRSNSAAAIAVAVAPPKEAVVAEVEKVVKISTPDAVATMMVVFAAVFEREDGVKCISGGTEVDRGSYPLDVIDAAMSECLNHPDPAKRISSVNEGDTVTLLWPDGRFSRHFYSDQAWWEELD